MERIVQIYKNADGAEKNKIIHDLCDLCSSSIATVQGWVRGYHKPTRPTINIIENYVKDNYEK